MWILHFLPDGLIAFIVNAILLLGVVGTVLSFFVINKILRFFPPMANYYKIAQVASIVLLLTGVYLKGGYNTEMAWRERVAELEVKLQEAEVKSAKVNTVIQEKVVTRTKVIKEKADTIVKYVDRPAVADFDKKCPIPKEVIDIHNEATEMNLIIDRQLKGVK